MSELFKKYSVVRGKDQEVLEEFDSLEIAEKFMIMMQGKGEDVSIKTNDEDGDDAPTEYEIEGLELDIVDENRFGSDLDVFSEDYEEFPDLSVDDDAPEVDID